MQTYTSIPITIKAIRWDGSNDTYTKIMESEVAGKVKSYVQPSQTLTIESPTNRSAVVVKIGQYLVVLDDGSFALYDEANFNAKFELVEESDIPQNELP